MNPYAKIDICNLALASIGADLIRSFDDKNKRARMCDVFYDFTLRFLLGKHDWAFARGYATLKEIDLEEFDSEVPAGQRAFLLPVDCARIQSMLPEGSVNQWEVFGRYLYTPYQGTVRVKYTKIINDCYLFSEGFINILSLGIAVRLCPSISQDKALTSALYKQYKLELNDLSTDDANIGNGYREYDETPENDSFVTGSSQRLSSLNLDLERT